MFFFCIKSCFDYVNISLWNLVGQSFGMTNICAIVKCAGELTNGKYLLSNGVRATLS